MQTLSKVQMGISAQAPILKATWRYPFPFVATPKRRIVESVLQSLFDSVFQQPAWFAALLINKSPKFGELEFCDSDAVVVERISELQDHFA